MPVLLTRETRNAADEVIAVQFARMRRSQQRLAAWAAFWAAVAVTEGVLLLAPIVGDWVDGVTRGWK